MPKFKLMAVQGKVLRYLRTRRAAEATRLTQHGGVPTRTFEASRLIGYLLEVRGQSKVKDRVFPAFWFFAVVMDHATTIMHFTPSPMMQRMLESNNCVILISGACEAGAITLLCEQRKISHDEAKLIFLSIPRTPQAKYGIATIVWLVRGTAHWETYIYKREEDHINRCDDTLWESREYHSGNYSWTPRTNVIRTKMHFSLNCTSPALRIITRGLPAHQRVSPEDLTRAVNFRHTCLRGRRE